MTAESTHVHDVDSALMKNLPLPFWLALLSFLTALTQFATAILQQHPHLGF